MDKETTVLKEKLNETEKILLGSEWVIAVLSTVILLGALSLASSGLLPSVPSVLIGALGIILFALGMCFCLKTEQTAGYYECRCCNHKYVPTFKAVFCSMHNGRTRYMKCPRCGEKSWQKKVLS